MDKPLHGLTIALAEGRQLEDLAKMLEHEGAMPLRCPLVSIQDAPDPAPVLEWLRALASDRFAYVVLMTGEGLRRLLGFARRSGLEQAATDSLRRARIVTRGPKPVRALREIGLEPALIADPPTTEGVVKVLLGQPVRGTLIGVQLYERANPELGRALEEAGAAVFGVVPYIYAPAADADRVAGLIGDLARGAVHVLIFTSSPQVERLYEVAGERRLETVLNEGLKHTRVAAIGPVVADNLKQRGARVDICPTQGFVMKNLVQHIKRACQ